MFLKVSICKGYIEQDYFPKIKGYVHERNLHLVSLTPKDIQPLDFIADTGFSSSVVLDTKVIKGVIMGGTREHSELAAYRVQYLV